MIALDPFARGAHPYTVRQYAAMMDVRGVLVDLHSRCLLMHGTVPM